MFQIIHLPGDPYGAGRAIGERSRDAVQSVVLRSEMWKTLEKWLGSDRLCAMKSAAASAFPQYMEEIRGIADGCAISPDAAFCWNARGDLLPISDRGCSSVYAPISDGFCIGHNEDGSPDLKEYCFFSRADAGSNRPGYVSFTYPGTLNGNTFALTTNGLVQTVNNIRITEPGLGVPRHFLARAVLDAPDLTAVRNIFHRYPKAGGFHHLIGQMADAVMLSIEVSGKGAGILELHGLYVHTNHLIHEGMKEEKQRITDSSRARQERMEALRHGIALSASGEEILRILGDRAHPVLPIYRADPDDPDRENTFATALFKADSKGILLTVYAGKAKENPLETDFVPVHEWRLRKKGGEIEKIA